MAIAGAICVFDELGLPVPSAHLALVARDFEVEGSQG